MLQYTFNRNIMISSKSKSSLIIQTNPTPSHLQHTYFSNRFDKPSGSSEKKFMLSPKMKPSKNAEKEMKEVNSKHSQQTQRSESKRESYFLRKSILQLYKFFQSKKENWNLHQLCYSQMLTLLKELKYIKFSEENEKCQNNQQLRKCYFLWLNLSENNYVKLANLIIFLTYIEKIQSDCQLIEEIVSELEKGIEKFPVLSANSSTYPMFLFYCKKQGWNFERGLLKLSQKQIGHIRKYFSSFLYTRLTQNEVRINLQPLEDREQHNFMSKRSVELAETKRKKILEQIKLRQPNMESIQLHHILNFKQQNWNSKEKSIKTQAFQSCTLNDKSKETKKNLKLKTNPAIQQQKLQQKCKTKNKQNFNNQAKGQKKTQNFKKKPKLEPNLTKMTKSQPYQQKNSKANSQTQDQLLEQAIPFHPQGIMMQLQKLQFKQDQLAELLAPQKNLFVPREEKNKEQKRREYIDLPILYVDVNIEQGKKERIVVYEGDKARELALEFGKVHNLPEQTVNRLEVMLQQQISSVLCKIDEAFEEDCSYLY